MENDMIQDTAVSEADERRARRERADVARGQLVLVDRDLDGLDQLIDRVAEVHEEHLGGALEALHVLRQAEHRGAVGGRVAADALEYAGAVVERVGEYMDLGFGPGHEPAVHPDEFHIRQCHVVSPSEHVRVSG